MQIEKQSLRNWLLLVWKKAEECFDRAKRQKNPADKHREIALIERKNTGDTDLFNTQYRLSQTDQAHDKAADGVLEQWPLTKP
jgi:hypothetical protein